MKPSLSIIVLILIIFLLLGVGMYIRLFDGWQGEATASKVLTSIKDDARDFTEHTIYIHKYTALSVALADEPAKRSLGLGGITALAPNTGMLFVFDAKAQWSIWMKGMQISIDILWLDDNGTIIDIAEQVHPDTYKPMNPKLFTPKAPARYVLEVASGYARTQSLHIGDTLNLGTFLQK